MNIQTQDNATPIIILVGVLLGLTFISSALVMATLGVLGVTV